MAVDERGVVTSAQEYDETAGFLQDARGVAAELTGKRGADARTSLSEIIAAVSLRRPPSAVAPLRQRLIAILGAEGMVELPSAPLDTAVGHQLFVQNCASCHGARALGDGPLAHGLSTTVPAIGSSASTPHLTPTLAYDVVSVGVRGTAMQPFGASLSAQQRWNAINYVYTLRGQQMLLPGNGVKHEPPSATAARIIALLDRARAGDGDSTASSNAAFDAYLAFEPLETIARAKDPGLVASLEGSFTTFKAAVRGGDVASTNAAYDAIVRAMPRVVALASETAASATTTFWQSFLIILREGFEAILVVGAVVAVLIKTGNRKRLRSIWLGAILGVIASLITAIVIKTMFSAIPASSEIVEAVSLLIAVIVLFSVSYWLISKVEAVKWQRFIAGKVSTALERGRGGALILVAFLAVYREGAETALFYQALFSQSSGSALPLILGIVAGAIALAIVFILFYRFGIRIPMRPFFAITSLLLYYMALVFAGRGIRELQEGNAISITPLAHIPNIPWLGLFPTVETVAIQGVLLLLFAIALLNTFVIRAGRQT